jgi:hypothetical protein
LLRANLFHKGGGKNYTYWLFASLPLWQSEAEWRVRGQLLTSSDCNLLIKYQRVKAREGINNPKEALIKNPAKALLI